MDHSLIHPVPQMLVLLAAAVLVVALFRRLKLSPVLGYLVAGAIIGPYGFGIISDVKDIAVIAELGVVFLLFVIGSGLSFGRMKSMKNQVFGVGGAQVLLTGVIVAAVSLQMGVSAEAAVLIGLGLALSSTALVLQVIQENREQNSQMGRLSLAVLLLQDMAVVPLLVLVPLLASEGGSIGGALIGAGVKAVLAFALVFIGGRLFLRPLFKSVASLEHAELFSAFTLLVVLGIGWAFHAADLSMALGAFVAGLLVAETEFKHQVEADIMPYKGLLLGLFFMVIGMKVDFALIIHEFVAVGGLVLALMLGKAAIILILCRLLHFALGPAIHTGLLLSQGGEFAFIVFGQALEHGLLGTELSQLLMVVVALSMALTPLAYLLGRKTAEWLRMAPLESPPPGEPEALDLEQHVVILGYGHVGQTVGKLLQAEGIGYIALDTDPAIVSYSRKSKRPIYYGDGTRREVLKAVSLSKARAAVITVNDFYAANKAVIAIKNLAPDLPVVVRTSDLRHLLRLEEAGADIAVSEMFEASLQLGGAALRQLSVPDHEVSRVTELFREQKYARVRADEFSPVADAEEIHEDAGEMAHKAADAMGGIRH